MSSRTEQARTKVIRLLDEVEALQQPFRDHIDWSRGISVTLDYVELRNKLREIRDLLGPIEVLPKEP